MLSLSIFGNLIIISIFLLAISFYITYFSKKSHGNFITESKFFKLHIVPKEDSKEYKKIHSLLENSYTNLTLYYFYSIKVITLSIAIILSLLIFVTNTSIKKQQYFQSNSINVSSLNSSSSAKVREQNFKVIKAHVSLSTIAENDTKSQSIVKNILLKYGNTNNVNDDTVLAIKDISHIKDLYSPLRMLKYGFFALIGFFIPELLLIGFNKVKSKKMNDEVYNLMNLITIICSNPNVSTVSLLHSLVNNSNYLSNLMRKFETSYLVNRESAYENFLSDSKMKPISKIVSLLRQIENSDRTMALKNIARNNENLEKIKKVSYENKVEQKEGVLLLLFAGGVIFLLKIIIDFSLNGLSNINTTNI